MSSVRGYSILLTHRFGKRAFVSQSVNHHRLFGTTATEAKPSLSLAWNTRMPEDDFNTMADILYAPSPVNLEGAMTSLLTSKTLSFAPKNWKLHTFKSTAALVVDTFPSSNSTSNKLTCMIVGHADKIRLQVKSIGSDGKVYISSDSHLPFTLLGNEVSIFSEDRNNLGSYREISGATVEALGAIHFADAKHRTGQEGLKPEQLYLELQIHGKDKKKQVTELLGIRTGDSVIMRRKIKRGIGRNSFTGAYLDNGLGCYVTHALSKLVATDTDAKSVLDNVRCLFAYATHEEIGRFGSRQLVKHFKPDVLIAVDVNHDYVAAPSVGDKHFPELEMGKGPTLSVGSITSNHINTLIQQVAKEKGIPLQLDVVGVDTGTDAMAGVLSSEDAASVSIGIPVRNMHTISECAVTDDVIAATHLIKELLVKLSQQKSKEFKHPDLSKAVLITEVPEDKTVSDEEKEDKK